MILRKVILKKDQSYKITCIELIKVNYDNPLQEGVLGTTRYLDKA